MKEDLISITFYWMYWWGSAIEV